MFLEDMILKDCAAGCRMWRSTRRRAHYILRSYGCSIHTTEASVGWHRAPNDAISTMLHPIARNAISRNKLKRARHLRSRIARTRAQLLCRSHFATPSPVSSSPQTCSETYAKSPRPAALNWNAALLIEFSHHHRALVDPSELNTVAWNYRERTGEIDDGPLAADFSRHRRTNGPGRRATLAVPFE